MNNGNQNNPHVRILLLDELSLFRRSLAHFLASQPGFEVTAECGKSAEALEALKTANVDLVLLDFNLYAEAGSDFISAARQTGYQGRFLILAGTLDARKIATALRNGVSGIFLKSEDLERLVQAIVMVAKGEVWLDRKIVQFLVDQLIDRYSRLGDREPDLPMQDRERDVLLGILEGLTNRKIGDRMGLSESSVKNIVQRLFGRAGVKTRSQLVRMALEGSFGLPLDLTTRHALTAHSASFVECQPVDSKQSSD